MVMYKRKMAKHAMHHTWHGPARVIGKDVHGYWLIHRGMPILAHPNNMRRAVDSEMYDNPGAPPADDEDGDDGPSEGPMPGSQRGVLDLTREIPDNPIERADGLDFVPQSRFGDGLPMSSHPADQPDQSFEPPDLPYDEKEFEYQAEDLLDPQQLPEDLHMIEGKADGWQIRAGHGPTKLVTNPENYILPDPFPEFELRTTWVKLQDGWYVLEDRAPWKEQPNPGRPVEQPYEKMIAVFNR